MHSPLMKTIHHLARCSTQYRDHQLKGSGLTGYQAPYLPLICRKPGLTQDEIAQQLHVNRSSVTRQLTLLEQEGFITRQRSESDRRSIQIYPEQKLLDMMPTLKSIFHTFRSAITDQMTADEVHTLTTLLDKLSARAEQLMKDCEGDAQ